MVMTGLIMVRFPYDYENIISQKLTYFASLQKLRKLTLRTNVYKILLFFIKCSESKYSNLSELT